MNRHEQIQLHRHLEEGHQYCSDVPRLARQVCRGGYLSTVLLVLILVAHTDIDVALHLGSRTQTPHFRQDTDFCPMERLYSNGRTETQAP